MGIKVNGKSHVDLHLHASPERRRNLRNRVRPDASLENGV